MKRWKPYINGNGQVRMVTDLKGSWVRRSEAVEMLLKSQSWVGRLLHEKPLTDDEQQQLSEWILQVGKELDE